jgi:hypothetical protein
VGAHARRGIRISTPGYAQSSRLVCVRLGLFMRCVGMMRPRDATVAVLMQARDATLVCEAGLTDTRDLPAFRLWIASLALLARFAATLRLRACALG